MRHYTIQQLADCVGVSAACLRTWEKRHCWPDHVRKDNGYRLYSERTVEMVAAFLQAGRPFHEIIDGVWTPRMVDQPTPAPIPPPAFLAEYADLDPRYLTALEVGAEGTVAHFLAALSTYRPDVRSRYVECARMANYELGGIYSALIARHRITSGHPLTRTETGG